jgi:hypothetical protein
VFGAAFLVSDLVEQTPKVMITPITPSDILDNFDKLINRLEATYGGKPSESWPPEAVLFWQDAQLGKENLLQEHPELLTK